ncbi:hypothetical protein GSbR_03950 [Geobacter sp. SVR]|nr:hypothetical protein GSVR_40990 [Geobacter sp. SVR]GCF83795.1 hypothetical protein GSbR_03950 [Geobacter sp. SVR]
MEANYLFERLKKRQALLFPNIGKNSYFLEKAGEILTTDGYRTDQPWHREMTC